MAITYGFKLETISETVTDEPITLASVKALANIAFSEHDAKLSSLIKMVREWVEVAFSVCLVDEKEVKFSYEEIEGGCELPYLPYDADSFDSGEETITLERDRITGDYPNGLEVTYTATKKLFLAESVKEAMRRMVVKMFEGSSLDQAKTEFKNIYYV